MRPGDEVLIDLQTTALTLGEVIERIESLRHSPRMAGHHITIDGVGISPGQRVMLAGNSICVGVLADCFRGLLGRQSPTLDRWTEAGA